MLRLIIAATTLLMACRADADEVKVQVGKPAPDFTVTGIDGKPFKLSEKLNGGKTNVAVMFSRAHW